MKIAFAICTTLIILTVSCKKSNNQINTPPVVTDTTKPPVVNSDTSLLKSELIYGYDYDISGNMTSMVSALVQWNYDDQRRVTQRTYAYFDSHDTTRYTYLNDRYIETLYGYTKGSLRAISNTVYYLGPGNRVDSFLTTITGYGIETGSNANYASYFYYNQENQETLEMHFSGVQGARSLQDSTKYFYTGMDLDSAIIVHEYEGQGGTLNYYKDVDYYSNGNLTSEFSYGNDGLDGVSNNTYTNIPTGGLYIADTTPHAWFPFSYRMPYLMSGSTGVSPPLINTQTYSYTYELDAANRVTIMTRNMNGLVDQKNMFTYY